MSIKARVHEASAASSPSRFVFEQQQQQQCVDAAIPVQMHSITLGRGDLAPL
jgi:hypothetical protein